MVLRKRLTLTSAALAIVPLLVLAAVWTVRQRSQLMAHTRGTVRVLAREAADQIDLVLARASEQTQQLAASTTLIRRATAATRELDGVDPDRLDAMMAEYNGRWFEADKELARETLEGDAAEELRRFQAVAPHRYAEILVTDRHGRLCAATNRTTDYYQADEAWWQCVTEEGDSRVCVGIPRIDESAGVLSVDIAAPVRTDGGELVGVLKVVHDAPALLDAIQLLTPGLTGQGVLTDESGTVLIGTVGTDVEDAPIRRAAAFLWSNGAPIPSSSVTDSGETVVGHAKLGFTRPADVVHVESGPWHILLAQSANEVYAPVRATLAWTLPILALPIGGVVLLYVWLRRSLVDPVDALHWASEQVAAGRLDARVNIETGGELQEVGTQFNRMVSALQRHERQQREEIRRRTDELRQSDIQERMFRQNVAAVMRSLSESLREATAEPVDSEDRRREIREITLDLEDLCSIQAGRMTLSRESVPIALLIRSTQRVLAPLIDRFGVQLDLPDFPTDTEEMVCDRAKTKQVMYALVSNAVRFGGKGSRVQIRARREDETAVLEVGDEGPGIPESRREEVFLPLVKQDVRREAPEEYLGASLSVARQFVQVQGGEIELESEPDEGSRFIVRLPVER